jgi:undecaprenyl-diphosphatase
LNPVICPFIGLSLFVLGVAYLNPGMVDLDIRLFKSLHTRFSKAPWVKLFQVIWPLGTTRVVVLVLVLLALLDLETGSTAVIVFAGAALFERGIKKIFKRPRPFELMDEVQVLQPRYPHDPSFPSGDAMRVWYLALVLLNMFEPVWWLGTPLLLLAVLVTLGRVALGVHHPLDALGGAGIGILAAGLWSILFMG